MTEGGVAADELFAQLSDWLAAANAVALLRAAYRDDVLHLLSEPMTATELATRLGVDAARTEILCQALLSHGLLRRDGDRYTTVSALSSLDGDDPPLLLRELVAANSALQRGIEECLRAGPGFSDVDERESLDLARLAWGRPLSPAAQAMWRDVDSQMPEVAGIWERGGSYAELGCGAGRDLLRVAVMYPRVRAVGYEVLPHLVEECRGQAEAAGLSDRVSIVPGDVLTLDLEDAYDTIMWSQMFFTDNARTTALRVIRRALIPGGYLLMPLMPVVPEPQQTDAAPATRALLLARLAYPRWGIQWDDPAEVRSEVENAGFGFVREIPNPRTPYLLFRAP